VAYVLVWKTFEIIQRQFIVDFVVIPLPLARERYFLSVFAGNRMKISTITF